MWALSAAISLAPLLCGWREIYSEHREACQVSRQPAYAAAVSTFSAFYLPLAVVLAVYGRVYRAARLRLGRWRAQSVHLAPEPVQVHARPSNPPAPPWLYPRRPSPLVRRKWDFLL